MLEIYVVVFHVFREILPDLAWHLLLIPFLVYSKIRTLTH
jgi:hypothetical protein